MSPDSPLKAPSAAAAVTDATTATSVTSATERAAGLTMSPEVLARLKGALPAVASHAVEAIIEEVPSYAERPRLPRGQHRGRGAGRPRLFLSIAARSDDPSTPLGPAGRRPTPGPGRGPQRSQHGCPAVGLPDRRARLVAGPVRGERARRHDAELLARFAELVFAYIDELSAASVAGHADELATAERVQQRQLERLALEMLRGASAELVTRRAERAGWDLPRSVTVLLAPDSELHHIRSLVDGRSLVLTEDVPGVDARDDVAALIVPPADPDSPAPSRPGPRRPRRGPRPHPPLARGRHLPPARPAGRGRRARAGARHTTPMPTWPRSC